MMFRKKLYSDHKKKKFIWIQISKDKKRGEDSQLSIFYSLLNEYMCVERQKDRNAAIKFVASKIIKIKRRLNELNALTLQVMNDSHPQNLSVIAYTQWLSTAWQLIKKQIFKKKEEERMSG